MPQCSNDLYNVILFFGKNVHLAEMHLKEKLYIQNFDSEHPLHAF